MLGIERSTVFQLIKSGELRSVMIGRRRLISTDTIHDYVRVKSAG